MRLCLEFYIISVVWFFYFFDSCVFEYQVKSLYGVQERDEGFYMQEMVCIQEGKRNKKEI